MPTLKELAEQAKENQNSKARNHIQPEAEEELLAIPSGNRAAVALRKIVQNGEVFYDLRRYVFRAGDASFVPTPKGVRLTDEQFCVLVEYIHQHMR